QMGVNGEIGIYQQILAELDAPMLNIYDGSFISSKLISEFGVIGALMCIFYFFYFSLFFFFFFFFFLFFFFFYYKLWSWYWFSTNGSEWGDRNISTNFS
ncbi:hypothetical protein J4W14_26385, partial [Escherichia coli]